MSYSPSSNDNGPRVSVNAMLSVEEATALQHLLERLTLGDCRQKANDDKEAKSFLAAAEKLRRFIESADELPVLPPRED